MPDLIDNLVGGLLLVLAVGRLVAAASESSVGVRARVAPFPFCIWGVLTLIAALWLTAADDFVPWLIDGSWVAGATCLLVVPGIAGYLVAIRR